jgi:hypothetical protein
MCSGWLMPLPGYGRCTCAATPIFTRSSPLSALVQQEVERLCRPLNARSSRVDPGCPGPGPSTQPGHRIPAETPCGCRGVGPRFVQPSEHSAHPPVNIFKAGLDCTIPLVGQRIGTINATPAGAAGGRPGAASPANPGAGPRRAGSRHPATPRGSRSRSRQRGASAGLSGTPGESDASSAPPISEHPDQAGRSAIHQAAGASWRIEGLRAISPSRREPATCRRSFACSAYLPTGGGVPPPNLVAPSLHADACV